MDAWDYFKANGIFMGVKRLKMSVVIYITEYIMVIWMARNIITKKFRSGKLVYE